MNNNEHHIDGEGNPIHFIKGKMNGVKGFRISDNILHSNEINEKRKLIRKQRKFKKKLLKKQRRKEK